MARNLIVDLSSIEDPWPLLDSLEDQGIDTIIPVHDCIQIGASWITKTFSGGWAKQFLKSASYDPPRCRLAMKGDRIIGFAGWDGTAPGLFGPEGVDEAFRGQGIGKALLVSCLSDMARFGYKYAIIWRAGPTDFYARTVGAVPVL